MPAPDVIPEGPLPIEERLAQQFYDWELPGRGWHLWNEPVDLEPTYRPFFGYAGGPEPSVDDGRHHTLLSGAIEWLHRRWTGDKGQAATSDSIQNVEPNAWRHDEPLTELQIVLSSSLKISNDMAEQFLLSLSFCKRPPAFEIVGTSDRVIVQFTCGQRDALHVEQQLIAHFPDIRVIAQPSSLADHWHLAEGDQTAIVELGLAREFVLPLAPHGRSSAVDTLTTMVAVLADVQRGEIALIQVLFQPVRHPWAESVLRSVTLGDGTPLFDSTRDFVRQARIKVSRPLYGAMIRVATRSIEDDRTWELAQRLVGSFNIFGSNEGNELMPLDNEGYDLDDHAADLLFRRSRRGGMILNTEELASLVHLPSAAVQTAMLRGSTRKTKTVPPIAVGHALVLGENEAMGAVLPVTLSADQRTRHTHVIGASGTGKSTFLLNLILQDIARGEGIGVLDPHGDLVDEVLRRIPQNRIDDVVLFDPADDAYPIGFNILAAHSDVEKMLISSDMVGIFRRLSTSWGDQMNALLANAVLAMLESEQGGTLLDMRRFLVERDFREVFLRHVRDPQIVYYWRKEFPFLSGKPQGPVLTRLDSFLRPKPIRHMVAQKANRLDFAEIMDRGRIFLARLSHGAIGEENAHLLGAFLVSKFNQMAMGRQQLKESERRHFWLYCDEFQHFATPSMASLLSGVRKYKLGLILAHQELHQLESRSSEVVSAVMANAFTRVCFRVSDQDARKLEPGFSYFEARDLQNLGTGEAICRVERADYDFNLRTAMVGSPDEAAGSMLRNRIAQSSRAKYATPRAEVENQLIEPYEIETATATAPQQLAPSATQDPASTPVVLEQRPEKPAPKPLRSSQTNKRRLDDEPMLGCGGPEHKYLQQLIKQWGEGMGFRATIEKPILNGKGRIDVALEKTALSIACLVSVTTGEEWELGNVRKCIAAGFKRVAIVSADQRHLGKLKSAIEPKLDIEEQTGIRFCTPQELFDFVQDLEIAGIAKDQTVRGYRVKTTYRKATAAEANGKREAISSIVAGAMRRVGGRRR